MRLTVLGSAASHAGAGQACSGYLVQYEEAAVLFDCGNGSLANLHKVFDPYALGAVFLTHAHPDHFVDIYSLQAMLRYAPEGPLPPMPLFAPEQLYRQMQAILSDRGAEQFREAFDFQPLRPGVSVHVGGLTVTPVPVDHTEPTYALVATDGSSSLCYTSDSAPGARVLEAARGVDLLLAEATLPEQYAGVSPHMTAGEVGELARDAGVKQLVLTHAWHTNDRLQMVADASAPFAKSVTVANEFDVFEL